VTQPNPYAPPQARVDDAPVADAIDTLAAIDDLPVSDKWKARFKAMHKAGGPNLPLLKELSPEDKKNVSAFNILAFLFCPFYYLAKGMWRKAITLFVLCFIGLLALEVVLRLVGLAKLTTGTGFAVGAVYAVLANRDYYSKMVLGKNGWWW